MDRIATAAVRERGLTVTNARGVFSRQLVLGDNLDLDRIEAAYADGVLRLVVPVAEKAKPRKIEISQSGSGRSERAELTA